MGVAVEPIHTPFRLPRALPKRAEGGNGICGDAPDRRAIYRSHAPSMDEGWTRWVLENQARCLFHVSVNDAQLRAGNLNRFDTIIIPDQAPRTILNGLRKDSMPPELTGGIGEAGVKELRKFVEQGGTLVLLNRASEFAIEQFKLPVRERGGWFAALSVLRTRFDSANRSGYSAPIGERDAAVFNCLGRGFASF